MSCLRITPTHNCDGFIPSHFHCGVSHALFSGLPAPYLVSASECVLTAPPDSSTTEVQLSNPCNFRDLGGLGTAHGTVRSGQIFRSDDVATVTSTFAAAMVDEHDIGHIIDLRSANEVGFTGRGPLAELPVAYHHLPLIDRRTPSLDRRPETPQELGHGYVHMLEHAAPRLAIGLQLVAAAEQAVVFHCAAGKDRTGLLAALLLTAFDVDHASIVADYARTDEVMAEVNERLVPLIAATNPNAATKPITAHHPILRAPAVTMTEFLTVSTERHGSPLAPLRKAGLSPETEQRLRQRYVE